MSNEWFERGELPPIGEVVMVNIFQKSKHEAAVIGAFERWVWLEVKNKGIDTFDISYVTPIRTEREKAIEAAIPVIERSKFCGFDVLAAELFDAGLLRLPEDKK